MKDKKISLILSALLIICSVIYIDPLPYETISPFHSSDLKEIKTIEGNVERIDYVKEDGTITIAANARFATKIVTNMGNAKLEEYLDDQGSPISTYSGYYALLREYDEKGNNISVVYLDKEKKPTIILEGFAAEKRNYDNENRVIAVWYLDEKMESVCTMYYGYGKKYSYDENGKAWKITYVDKDGEPMVTSLGYATITRSFNDIDGQDKGKVEAEFYFDENGEPACLSMGQYGVRKEYDDDGEEAVLTYLDQNGVPIITTAGYATVVRTFYSNGTVLTEMYYDTDGNPIALDEGQYGVKWVNGMQVYLDKDGKTLFNIKSLVYQNAVFVIPVALLAVLASCMMGKRINIGFLILYGGVICYFTLMYREGNGTLIGADFSISLQSIFVDSERRAENLKNIWLFVPLGAILYNLCTSRKILLFPFGASLLIEALQYLTRTGMCELYDLISNSLGGVIGYGLAGEVNQIKHSFCNQVTHLRNNRHNKPVN